LRFGSWASFGKDYKHMKKFLKITVIVVISMITLLLVLPYAFRGKIKEVIISEGNKMLNAQFDFGSVNISLIRNFPKATISVKDIAVWGIEDFANDTLFVAHNTSVAVNLRSLFSDSGYDISGISLSGVNLKTIALDNGSVNWDIMKPSEDGAEAEDDSSTGFRVKLRSVKISDGNFIYDDRGANMYISAAGIAAGLSGDMTASEALLKIKGDIASFGVRYGGIAWISEAKASADGKLNTNFDDMRFTFSDNTVISLNAITAGVEGMFALLEDGYDMDISLNTEKVGFKEILSMIPAVYAKDFSSLKADGEVSLSAWAKGVMTDEKIPAFDASLNITGGSFRYPSLPKGVDNIEVKASASGSGGDADNTVIDVKSMRFSIAGNPFSAAFRMATPVSDPDFSATAKGILDLGMIKEIYPLEDMELNGILDANFDLAGRYSYMEREEYDKFKASGNLGVKDMIVKVDGMPDVNIARSLFTFTPKYLQLGETSVEIGKSDITGDFKLENYIGFILKDDILKGSASIRSGVLDVNELMGDVSEDISASETDPLKAFEIPKNIDLNMNASLKKVYFGNMDIDNINGELTIRDGKLNMKNISLETMGGSAVANGYYSTAAAGIAEPELNASFKMNNLLFSESFKTFEVIQKLAPVFENLKGSFSGNMSLNTKLDSLLSPKLDGFNAEGLLTTTEIALSGVTALDKLADLIKYEPLKNINTRDIKISFDVKNGRLGTKPFDIKMGSTNLNLSGTTGIDKTIDYRGKINIPASMGILGSLGSADFVIGGTFSDPKISLDTKGMANQVVDVARDRVLEEIGERLGIDIADAEKQRAALIEEAQKAGDKLVEEAKKKVQESVDKVEGRLAKIAAERAGEKIIQEAEKQSAALVTKATEEGDKLVEKAKKQ